MTGFGIHSTPGKQGESTVMVHSMLRLFFGQVQKPLGSYSIDVTEVTNFGRLLISVSEQVQINVSVITFIESNEFLVMKLT